MLRRLVLGGHARVHCFIGVKNRSYRNSPFAGFEEGIDRDENSGKLVAEKRNQVGERAFGLRIFPLGQEDVFNGIPEELERGLVRFCYRQFRMVAAAGGVIYGAAEHSDVGLPVRRIPDRGYPRQNLKRGIDPVHGGYPASDPVRIQRRVLYTQAVGLSQNAADCLQPGTFGFRRVPDKGPGRGFHHEVA